MKTITKMGLLAIILFSFTACTKEPLNEWCEVEDACEEPDRIHFDINWDCEEGKGKH